jgi:hypothetical protein
MGTLKCVSPEAVVGVICTLVHTEKEEFVGIEIAHCATQATNGQRRFTFGSGLSECGPVGLLNIMQQAPD